jgi:hypothetical protein
MVMTGRRLVADLAKSRELDGICPEVIDLLRDRAVNPGAFSAVRKMAPARQVEAAELMIAVGNWSATYAQALLAATKGEDLAKPGRAKKVAGLTPAEIAEIERELAELQADLRAIECTYADDALLLVAVSGYLAKLVANPEISSFLERRYPDVLDGFHHIASIAGATDSSLTRL